MTIFRNTDHLYRVIGALFDRVQQEKSIVSALVQGNMVVQFEYKNPEGLITVDIRREPISYFFGPSDLKPDVKFINSGDTAHRFWLGQLNVPMAVATRKVIARGAVPKALALLPALKPIFTLYPQVLREIGEESIIPSDRKVRIKKKKWQPSWFEKRKSKLPDIDFKRLSQHLIPLIEGDSTEEIEMNSQKLPTEENEFKREMFRCMVFIRVFEERLIVEFEAGRIPTEALHLSIGQEACAVGACFALGKNDYMTTTHRGHGHMIAMGASINRMAAELFGNSDGLCGGLGGCMHVTDAQLGALGANGIVGASSLIAIGAAFSAQMRKTPQVALTFVGDGATAQGMFHEALNFAAVFNLPVVFFIENNQYAEFTPLKGHSRLEHLSQRAAGHGLPGITVDGNDIWAVYKAVKDAASQARKGGGPTLIEGVTYRWSGHYVGESARYRSEEEVEEWKTKDPISRFKKELLSSDLITGEEINLIEKEALAGVEEAISFAASSPEPKIETLSTHVFVKDSKNLYSDQPEVPATREASVSRALWEAHKEEMERDERVYLIGEDVRAGGYFSVTAELVDHFGPKRIVDTPISEYAIVGSAIGAAMTGMRPVAEIAFSDFITCCMDPLVNQAAKLRLMSGGQFSFPLVVRTPGGAGIGMAAQHSQSLESWLMNIPGLIIIAPGTPYDSKGLLKAAIRSNNPVVFFENKLLYAQTGPVPTDEYLVPIGKAEVKKKGNDMTLVAVGATVNLALEAASQLENEGIDIEVVDPRTLYPCDWGSIIHSGVKTGRMIVIENGHLTCGFGAECAARMTEFGWGRLKTPVRRIAGMDVPFPYNRRLENAVVPSVERIVEDVKAVLR